MKDSVINITITIGIGLLLVLNCSSPKESNIGSKSVTNSDNDRTTSTSESDEKPIAISSKDLTKTYEENELAANDKYKDKVLAVSGKIDNIAETFGNITVSLQGHNAVVSVMCNFDETEKANVTKLKKGQQVILVGKGDGMTAGLYVGLQKCKIQ